MEQTSNCTKTMQRLKTILPGCETFSGNSNMSALKKRKKGKNKRGKREKEKKNKKTTTTTVYI